MKSFSRDYLELRAMDEREAWECVYYAKYSSGYILGNSLTGAQQSAGAKTGSRALVEPAAIFRPLLNTLRNMSTERNYFIE